MLVSIQPNVGQQINFWNKRIFWGGAPDKTKCKGDLVFIHWTRHISKTFLEEDILYCVNCKEGLVSIDHIPHISHISCQLLPSTGLVDLLLILSLAQNEGFNISGRLNSSFSFVLTTTCSKFWLNANWKLIEALIPLNLCFHQFSMNTQLKMAAKAWKPKGPPLQKQNCDIKWYYVGSDFGSEWP